MFFPFIYMLRKKNAFPLPNLFSFNNLFKTYLSLKLNYELMAEIVYPLL